MRVLDLFAGIGGFSLAAHWMGWETVAFVERDKFCQKVLRKNFGQDIDIYDDICTFSGEPFRGTVDLITGGFPCQPFSAAGKRKGRDDERHLFPELLRVVDEVKPRWVVAENVRGLLSIEDGRVFEEVNTSLEGIGYAVQTLCIPASAVDAPHRRDRLWIVAHAIDSADRANRGAVREADSIQEVSRPAMGGGMPCGAISNATHDSALNVLSPSHGGREYGQSWRDGRVVADSSVRTPRKPDIERCGEDARHTEGARLTGGPDRSREAQYGRTGARDFGFEEHWVQTATRLCRVDDVVPNRVDRLKSLGNAVVPALVFEIFKAIETAEHETETQDSTPAGGISND